MPKEACEPVSGIKSPTRVASGSCGDSGSFRGSGVGVGSTLFGVKAGRGNLRLRRDFRARRDSVACEWRLSGVRGDSAAATAGATTGEGEAAASGGGTGACSGRTGACSSTEGCCAATACWGACSGSWRVLCGDRLFFGKCGWLFVAAG